MPVNFNFEEAPASRGPRTDPAEFTAAQELRANPGREARVFEYDNPGTASVTARVIRKGARPAFGSGFIASARTIDGKGVVYVTYVGDGSDAQ